jgi:hypothetical protein
VSHCKATMKWKLTTKGPTVELACDLDEGHLPIYPRHFDKTVGPTGLEWIPGAQPQPVASTRTNPSKPTSVKKRAAVNSISAHTTQFEVLSVG